MSGTLFKQVQYDLQGLMSAVRMAGSGGFGGHIP